MRTDSKRMDWSQDEVDRLMVLAAEEEATWKQVAKVITEEFGEERTATAARKRYKREKKKQQQERENEAEELPAGMTQVEYDWLVETVEPLFTDLKKSEMDLDEWLDALEAIQALRLKAEPHTQIATVKIETDKPIIFCPTSCWHLGGLYTNYSEFRDRLSEVLSIPRFYWGIHGDEWEAFPPGWASTVFTNLIAPHLQRRLVAKIVDKLHERGALLYSMWSNHPAFFERLTGEDQARTIYRDKIPYFAGKGLLLLDVGEQRYILDLAHVFPGTSYHNPLHAQGRELKDMPFADMVVQGDKHSFAMSELAHHGRAYDAGLLDNRTSFLVQTGTAKDGPDPYTLRSWSRGVFIWPTFALSGKKHVIHRVHDLETAKWYLQRDDF